MMPLVMVGRPGNWIAYPGLTLAEALSAHIEHYGPGPWRTQEIAMDRPFWVYDATPIPIMVGSA